MSLAIMYFNRNFLKAEPNELFEICKWTWFLTLTCFLIEFKTLLERHVKPS